MKKWSLAVVCSLGMGASIAHADTLGNCGYQFGETRLCLQVGNVPVEAEAEVQGSCEQDGGVWTSRQDCSRDALVGLCDLASGDSADVLLHFYPPTSIDEAKQICADSEGVWVE